MKNIKAKFKMNCFTYMLILTSLVTGFIKNILLILCIVIVHEFGHILMIHHFEYEIEKVEIFPFGGITKVNKPINTPLKKEIWIALGGVLFQFLLFLVFYLLFIGRCPELHSPVFLRWQSSRQFSLRGKSCRLQQQVVIP